MTLFSLDDPSSQPIVLAIEKIVQAHFPRLQGLYLFGSVASGQDNHESDLDLALLLPEAVDPVTLWECAEQLGSVVKRHVDLVDLQAASTVMRVQVISNGQRILTLDEKACQEFEMLALSMYVRFNEERKDIIDAIRQDKRVLG